MNHVVMFNNHRESALLQGSGEKFCADNRPWDGATIDDPLKRLTAILNRNSAGAIITKYEYTYNNYDLKDTETITGASPLDNLTDGTTTYTPNDVNQIVSSTNPNRTYAYDNDGNMTTGFTPEGYTLALSYDAASRLIKAEYTDSGNTVHKTEYTYDGDDLLAIMKKTIGTSITETRYIRAGFLPIQERNGSNAITREYLWGQDMGGGIGGLLNLRQSGADYNYLYDGKGNVTSLIDSAQATVAQYVYDPFGRVMKKTGTLDQPFQFSTKQYDPETGHSDYGHRFYSAELGRWLTKDPLGEAGGVNLYQMVGNNPVNWADPWGLRPVTPGLPNLVNPGSVPNMSGLLKQTGAGGWQREIDAMNAADDALFNEARNIHCGEKVDYYIYYGRAPRRFIGIGRVGEPAVSPSDTERWKTTLTGTKGCDCSKF